MKKITNYIKENKKTLILLSIPLTLFLLLSYAVFSNMIYDFDMWIHSFVLNIRSDSLTSILLFITDMASAKFLIILSVLLLIFYKKKKYSLYICINLGCAFLTNEIFKNIFIRERPLNINLIEETGFSYPSGHSMVCLSYYGFIAYLLYINSKSKILKSIIILSLVIITLVVGFSRIYLGVHYFTDVIAGFLLSIIYLIIYIKIMKIEKK